MKPVIILVEPQLDQNIGKVARAMLNFDLDSLSLVAPKAEWLNKSARALSAGADIILENAKVFDRFEDAIGDLKIVYATTVRPREIIKDVIDSKMAALEVLGAIEKSQDVGIVFGPERTGLENSYIARCNKIITVPLNPEFSSLNLAQAVVLVAYEIYQANKGISMNSEAVPGDMIASRQDIDGLIQQLDHELDSAGYYRTDDKRSLMHQTLVNIFSRLPLHIQEVRTLRGVISTLVNPNGIYSRESKRKKRLEAH
jgi:tRNA/rRNA methyltransferase